MNEWKETLSEATITETFTNQVHRKSPDPVDLGSEGSDEVDQVVGFVLNWRLRV